MDMIRLFKRVPSRGDAVGFLNNLYITIYTVLVCVYQTFFIRNN